MAVSSKAEQLLGLTKEHEALQTSSVDIQGVIKLRDPSGNTKRRFCSVKDGFFIWFKTGDVKSDASKLPLDKKPLGIMPLNETLVHCNKYASDKNEIEITHMKLTGHPLLLTVFDLRERNEWLAAIEKGQRTTFENAELGAADLDAARAKGTELEAEKIRTLQELEVESERLEKAKQSQLEVLKREKEQHDKFLKKITVNKEKLKKKQAEQERLEAEAKRTEENMEKIQQQRKELEAKLSMADIALRSIEAEFSKIFPSSFSTASVPSQSYSRGSMRTHSSVPRNTQRLARRSELIVEKNAPPIPPLPPMVSSSRNDGAPGKVSKETLQQSVQDLRSFFEGLSAANRSRFTVRTTRVQTFDDSEA